MPLTQDPGGYRAALWLALRSLRSRIVVLETGDHADLWLALNSLRSRIVVLETEVARIVDEVVEQAKKEAVIAAVGVVAPKPDAPTESTRLVGSDGDVENGNNITLRRLDRVIQVDLEYPRLPERAIAVEVQLADVRAADGVRVEFDFGRNGWSIQQERWVGEDPDIGPRDTLGWEETAFAPAWALDPTAAASDGIGDCPSVTAGGDPCDGKAGHPGNHRGGGFEWTDAGLERGDRPDQDGTTWGRAPAL